MRYAVMRCARTNADCRLEAGRNKSIKIDDRKIIDISILLDIIRY